MISSRIQVCQSQTVAVNSRVSQLRTEGRRIYNLSAGEPIIPLHPVVREELCVLFQDQSVAYAPTAGLLELRECAAEWMNTLYGTSYDYRSVLITPGGKFGLYAFARTYLGINDDVLAVAPYWVSYSDIPQMAGASVTVIRSSHERGWKISAEDIDRACSKKTRAIFLNNACNPTGVVYTRNELAAILACAANHDLMVIADEVYSGLVYDGGTFVSCGSFPEYRDRVVIIQSMSKHFAMTGWRVGWVAAPDRIISDLLPLQSNSVTCASTVSQWAALAALHNTDTIMSLVRDTMQQRRDLFCTALRDILHSDILAPQSALYCFVPLTLFGRSDMTSAEFCLDLLERAGIAAVPGSAFGAEGFVRFAFGEREEELKVACEALQNYKETQS